MFTECNAPPITLSSLRRQKLLLEFNGGPITSDAGALLLREADLRLRLTERAAACLRDPRNQDLILHRQRTMVAQRIMALACGWEDLNDHRQLRADPLWQIASGQGIQRLRQPDGKKGAPQPLASPPTLCRLEHRADREGCWKLSALLVDLFIESQPTPPAEVVLDFDATDDPVHGQQEGRFFHGYYDEYCFLPLYVFCGSQPLCAYLRPSNIDASYHAWAVLKLLVDRLRKAWPQVRIVVRADSGFCRWRMLRWCDRHGLQYVVGVARNAVLQRLAETLMQKAEDQFKQAGQKQRLFDRAAYQAGTWDRPRPLIIKAEHNDQGPNPRFLVSNLTDEAAALYDERYCRRGQMENHIKEQQLGLFADRTSCHHFVHNQLRVLLSALAYVLVDYVRRVALVGTELAQAQADTIRLKLLKIGAVVCTSVRRLVLHLSGGYPLRELFRLVCRRLREIPLPTRPLSAVQLNTG
ncbi:MAG: IS1380 family transposase [Planctomycetes bacterium]|nr:IS1380 family transposase [Planctomycetota bacterium]